MKPSQAIGRTRRLLPPRLMASAMPARIGEFRPHAQGLLAEVAPQSAPAPAPHQGGLFTAVGASRPFSDSPAFWLDRSTGLLFLFYLHGFAELPRALDAAELPRALDGAQPPPIPDHTELSLAPDRTEPARAASFWSRVVASWLDLFERPTLPAWHPYPTSLRVIAWCIALSGDGWDKALRRRMVSSLWRQAHYLSRSIEHDIGGNHVLKNTTALAFAGACFPESHLLDRALAVLRRELPRQFLADGGHEERSTSYHREALGDLCQVAKLLERAGRPVPEMLRSTIERANAWLTAIVGPDLRLPLLNDSWEGPPLERAATEELTVLGASGHVVVRHGSDQAVFDCGPLAPRHLPPHAHADALSVVAWFDGAPLLVDRGAFSYSGPRREQFRATAAHNTVEIEHQSQCVFWGDFRASRLPRVRLEGIERVGDVVLVSASHDGYRRLPGGPIHQRVLVWLPGDGLLIVDRIASSCVHAVRSFLHLVPAAQIEDRGHSAGHSIGEIVLRPIGPLRAGRVAERHAPWLGTDTTAEALVQQGTIGPQVPFGWSLLREDAMLEGLDARTVRIRRFHGGSLELALQWPPDGRLDWRSHEPSFDSRDAVPKQGAV